MSTDLETNYAFKTLKNIHKQINLQNVQNKTIPGKFNLLYLNINALANKLDELESLLADFTINNPKKKFISLL